MRLTRSGALAGLAAVGLVGLGRLLGLPELYAIGAAVGLLIAVCLAWVVFRNIDLSVTRRVRPHRVHAGNPCTVEITVKNLSGARTPVLRLIDPVTNTAGADLFLPPVDMRRPATVSYVLPTTRRGIVTVGPMEVEISDPFGVTAARSAAARPVEVTVLPHIDEIPPLPRSVGPDPDGPAETGSLGRTGDEFAALRPYQVGDDLRLVHWPSSARTGDLLVRQHDVPWQGRVCVVLDARRQSSDGPMFERAVSAAASVLRTHVRRGDHVRLITTSGFDSGYGVGRGHLDSLYEQLAVVSLTATGSLGMALGAAERSGSGALVLVSGRPTATDLEVLDARGKAFGLRRVVRFDESGIRRVSRRTDIVGAATIGSFVGAWSDATALLGRRNRRLRTASAPTEGAAVPGAGR